ncbi:MAG: hypothetical protein CVV56_04125 [Tenericutes bacterium HGW-Tenericutes-1]|jgi:putative Mn2+ efflux pump MntP|nr:MAG: hypothetical protein CVV56_04125 [Tenericutes bacterium HGW-Tenericutes-1]
MAFWVIILLAFGLSMDAFAVSICKGTTLKKSTISTSLIIGLCFGLFQAIMPIIGYYLGSVFHQLIDSFDHWIAFVLLAFVGAKMILDAIKSCEGNVKCDITLSYKELFMLGIATSIDAFAIGITISCIDQSIWLPSLTIGLVTFIMSFFGSILGKKLGSFVERQAGIIGGIVLILLAFKVLIEGLQII